jgi:hypothetical protein
MDAAGAAYPMTAAHPDNFYARRHANHSMRWRARARIRAAERDGQALVEFVLVLPLLLLLFVGIMQFGLALNTTNDETHLANEVARYLTVNFNPATEGSLVAWAKSQADTNFLESEGQICIQFPKGSEIGQPVEVTTHTTMKWLPVLGLVETTLTGKAVMRLEREPSSALLAGSEC